LSKIETQKEKRERKNVLDKLKNQVVIKKTLKNNFLSKYFESTKIKK
jgi:hypothetical protein